MSHFEAVLTHPAFAHWFARVHPFFWPMLYWQMWRHFRWKTANRYSEVLVKIEWWGGITVVYCGDKHPDPSAYRA